MLEEKPSCRGLPGLVNITMSLSEGQLFSQGNLIEPIIVYRKEDLIREPVVIEIAKEVLASDDIRQRVVESVRQFVFENGPDELVLVREGFFVGQCTQTRCVSLIYSTPSGERTWVAAIGGNVAGPWREILVKSGEFYQLYEKATYRWN